MTTDTFISAPHIRARASPSVEIRQRGRRDRSGPTESRRLRAANCDRGATVTASPTRETRARARLADVVFGETGIGKAGHAVRNEALVIRTLVELADTLVDDFDVVDLSTLLSDRCVEVFDVAAAGIMLVAPEGELRVVASSSETMRVVELFEVQSDEGPCVDCFRTGTA